MTKLKKTPIGKIPENWEVVRVREIFDVKTGTTPSTKQADYWENGEINWITPTDLSKLNGNIYLGDSERKITKRALEDYNLSFLPKGSLILSTRAPVGYVAVLTEETTFNQGCKGLVPKDWGKIIPEFYAYYFKFRRQHLESLSGGSTFKELAKAMLERFLVPLPPLSEQKKIAEILRTVDEAIEKTDEAIERTERLKKGLMQRLLTRGIGHERFKKTELGEIPEEWLVVKLIDYATVLKGFAFSSKFFNEDGKGLPLIRIRDLDKNATEAYYSGPYDSEYLVDPGDILVSMDGEFNVFIWNGPKGLLNQRVAKIESDSQKLDRGYLYYAIKKPLKIIEAQTISTTVKHLLDKDIKRILLPLPSIEEQKQIAEILFTVDRKLELLRQRRERFERVKRGLMKDLLTGRRRVKVE